MDQSYAAVEQRIADAMEALDQNEYDNAANAARAFKVDARGLQRRVAGGPSCSESPATNTSLTPAQELCICQYPDQCDSFNMSARLPQLRKAANTLLRESGSDRVVGQHWPGDSSKGTRSIANASKNL